ncbi:DNA replication protein DnaC [Volucribacter psittacicida]|uniref:DNA replication protein DnaC n=1 Tax=Volucribacter psittacicida TaxID=203482 RepID=A0A4R1FXZ8_9PAST|nr:ATP-binding protein [Volucribacter psittacicida]TCJ96171.1 DNA replication protein DnaC [Volucribacter psittacicida]
MRKSIDELRKDLEDHQEALKCASVGFTPSGNTEVSRQQVVCEKHGVYTQHCRKTTLFGGKTLENKTRCPRCLQQEISALEAEIRQVEQAYTQRKINDLKAKSGVAKRFEQASFDNYQDLDVNSKAKRVCEAYAKKWQERKAVGGGLILTGKPGTGKSHLACAIANYVIEKYQDDVLMTTALRIMRKVKSTWEKNADLTESEVIEVYVDKDLLIIDEVGVQFGSEAEKIILFEIINERYEQLKPTILISNLLEDELAGYIGERVIDRMREGKGAMIAFDWESYRK